MMYKAFFAKLWVWICLLFSGPIVWATPSTLNMTGTWVAENPLLTRVEIYEGAQGLSIYAFRDCDTGECDWGAGEVQVIRTSQHIHLSVYFLSAIGEATIEIKQLDPATLVAKVEASFIGKQGGMESVQTEVKMQPATMEREPATPTFQGSILATPVGDAQSTASLFHVSLYGPDNTTQLIGIQSLLDAAYFSGLAPGTYVMYIEPKGPTGVQLRQERYEFLLDGNGEHTVEVELY